MAFLHGRRGVTLIEQLVALLLGSLIVSALYVFYRSELFHFLSYEARTETLADARGALDIIVRDLKNAGAWRGGTVPPESGNGDDPDGDPDTACNRVYAATANLLHVQMDLNGNGDCADTDPRENIRYELTGPTSSCPGTKIIRRNGDCLVANVQIPPGDRLFRYYDRAGMELGEAPARSAIKRIRIAFSVQVKDPDPKNDTLLISTTATSLELRN